jgi:ElaA protein
MSLKWQTSAFADLTSAELYALLRLRQEVFVVEQQSLYLDLDGKDLNAIHMLCWQGGELVAYQRLLPPGLSYPESAIGRIVVSRHARGRDLGRTLVRRGIAHNLDRWPEHDIRINAQSYLRRFYQQLGFAIASDEYDEDGIPHVQMLFRRRRDTTVPAGTSPARH